MRAAILCPGPSLIASLQGEAAPGADFDGSIIGVNRAALLPICDVWACCNVEPIVAHRDQVKCAKLLTCREVYLRFVNQAGGLRSMQVLLAEDLYCFLDPNTSKIAWTLFTLPTAIVYAASAGATDITLYGADWKGELDFDGATPAGDRSPDRWKTESQIVTRLIAELAGSGITVRRIQP